MAFEIFGCIEFFILLKMWFIGLLLIGVCLGDLPTLQVNVTDGIRHAISPDLFGIFFEEINHAGQGGLHAELIRNSGFESAQANLNAKLPAFFPWEPVYSKYPSEVEVSVENSKAMNPKNTHYLKLSTKQASLGVSNPGYWGVSVEQGKEYHVSFFGRSLDAKATVTVQIVSDRYGVIGTAHFKGFADSWKLFNVTVTAAQTDGQAKVVVLLDAPTTVLFDLISVLPASGIFRQDLLQKLVDLKPRFMRFPGGCYVEGDKLADAFIWTNSIGGKEQRPGHWNLWNYYSEDFLGLYEYLQLCEIVNTKPVWVINNGVAHADSINPKDIQPWVDSALNSIEFIMGSSNTTFGAMRANLGHEDPFTLEYMAIGNEDCGKPFYLENYNAFYKAIKSKYPQIQLIANCDISSQAAVDVYDYHIYTSADDLIKKRNIFDSANRKGPKIFNSEYAVTQQCGRGNLRAAVAEAAWMTGLERNSDIVTLASYAPLFVNDNDRKWNPDAIVFNSALSYGTPSYYVQKMFTENMGEFVLASTLQDTADQLAVSSSFVRSEKTVILKIVNFAPSNVSVKIVLDTPVAPLATNQLLTSSGLDDENAFETPEKIVPVVHHVKVSENFTFSALANSVNILRLTLQ
jgi:alpha-N-arabinofuranosidase